MPLVIIAPSYDHVVRSYFHTNLVNFMNHNKTFKVIPIDISLKNNDEKALFEDIALKTNWKIFKKDYGNYNLDDFNFDNINEYLGRCKIFKATNLKSYIIGSINSDNSVELKNKVNFLNSEIDKLTKNEITWELKDRIYSIKRRISILTGSMITFYIGGNSEDEKDTNYYLIEDAIFAVKSAIQYGYVPGCNRAIMKVIRDNLCNSLNNDIKMNLIYDVIIPSIDHIYHCLLSNAGFDIDTINDMLNKLSTCDSIYNIESGEYEDFDTTRIVNSVETDIEIIKNVISIVTLLMSSNQFIEFKNYNVTLQNQ